MMYISYTFNDKQARIYMSDVYTGPSASEIAYAVRYNSHLISVQFIYSRQEAIASHTSALDTDLKRP